MYRYVICPKALSFYWNEQLGERENPSFGTAPHSFHRAKIYHRNTLFQRNIVHVVTKSRDAHLGKNPNDGVIFNSFFCDDIFQNIHCLFISL